MLITTEQALQPFSVPNYVLSVPKAGLRSDGLIEVPKYTLGELSVKTLELLCDQFREDVMARAKEQRDAPRASHRE